MKKIRMIQLISRLETGGAENVLLSIVNNLDEKKYDLLVCGIFPGKKAYISKMTKPNIRVVQFNIQNRLLLPLAVLKLYNLIKRHDIEIIQSHLLIDNLVARLAGKLAGILVVTGKHDADTYKSPLNVFIDVHTGFLSDAITAVMKNGVREWLSRGYPKHKLHLIPNAVDLEKYNIIVDVDKFKKELKISGKGPIIGCVGRLNIQKGHTYLIEGMKKVVKEYKNTRLLLVGDGPLEMALKKQVKDSNLSENILFLGKRKDVSKILKILDVFILPSLWEGMPLTVLEAMAAGVPIIASSVDGTREIIKHGKEGILIKSKDPYAISQSLLYLLRDKRLSKKLSFNSKSTAKNRFSLKRMVSAYSDVYVSLVRSKK